MSVPAQRIEASIAQVGAGVKVRRALPTRHRRLIGAWCFLDHFGPVHVKPGAPGMAVPPHPHCGLQTVTWIVEGELFHRDSLGSAQPLRAGQLNLMTSGRGIAHAEDSPPDRSGTVHAVQFWIALPESRRHGEPAFDHYPVLPRVERGGATVTVLAGTLLGARSPAKVYSPLVGADVTLAPGAALDLPVDPGFEHGVVVLKDSVQVDGEALEPGSLLYFAPGRDTLHRAASSGGRAIVVGGVPFAEGALLWWNFVARTKSELVQACKDWNHGPGYFGTVKHPAERLLAPMPPWAALEGDSVVAYP